VLHGVDAGGGRNERPELDAAQRLHLAADGDALLSSGDEAALRAAIFERPDDDGPRSVYADWLQERGNRCGDFIAAQLRGDAKTALKHLDAALASNALPLYEETDALPKHAGLGATGKPALRCFDRGFLRACEVRSRAATYLDADAWPVVEWLKLTAPGAEAFISALAPRLTSLHSFTCRDGAAARTLAALRPKVLRRLTIHELRAWFELAPLVDAQTELDLSAFFAVRVRRRGAEVKLELQGSRGGPGLERLLRFVVLPGARVELSWAARGDDPHVLVEEVRRTVDPLAASVTELPEFVLG
jgi:uncharacterized protein (TIGR02996 family)